MHGYLQELLHLLHVTILWSIELPNSCQMLIRRPQEDIPTEQRDVNPKYGFGISTARQIDIRQYLGNVQCHVIIHRRRVFIIRIIVEMRKYFY